MSLKYLGNQLKNSTAVSIRSTRPLVADPGDLWWDSDDGTMKIYYRDADTAQWVEVNTGSSGPAGQDGQDGQVPTISIGAVTTVTPQANAAVTITPTPTGIALNFDVPKGDRGLDGRAGPKTVGLAYPSTADTQIVMFYTHFSMQINRVTAIIPGALSGSSIAFQVRYGSSISSGTPLVTWPTSAPLGPSSTPSSLPVNPAVTIPSGTLVWLEVNNVVGTIPLLSVTVETQ